MIIQELKKNKIEFLFFVIYSILFYYLIFVLKGNSFIAEDDLAHTILKPQTLFNCFKSNCEGISFFLNDIANNFYTDDKKLLERQIHRITSQYTFLTDTIYYSFYLLFNNWELSIISMIVLTSIFKFAALVSVTNIFFKKKTKTFFFIFISIIFISTPGFEPHWGQNLTAYFFLICLSLIYFGKSNSIKIIFFIFTLFSHANGIILASVLALYNFLTKYQKENKILNNINIIDFLMGTLIIFSYLFYNIVNLDSAPLQSLYVPEGNYIIKNIFLIYNYFKIIPPTSAGIIFMIFIIVYLMTTEFEKKINFIFISIATVYFLIIFTGSALMIYKKSIFLFTLIFYTCFFVLFISLIKKINFKDLKKLFLQNSYEKNSKNIFNLVLFAPLVLIFLTIIQNFIFENPKKFFRSHVSGSINNHNLEAYNRLINNLDNNKIIFNGSEAGMYYALNSGLSKRRFMWVNLKDTQNVKPGIYNYIFNSKVHAGGRLTSSNKMFQFYNSIVLTKNNKLILDISDVKKKPKEIIFGFKKIDLKKKSNITINKKKIKLSKNEIIFKNNLSNINQLILSTENNLILTKIQFDDQSSNWPYNKNLSLKIEGEIYTHKDKDFFSKKNNIIEFNELKTLGIDNCKFTQIDNDELTLNFAKIKCF